VHVIVVGAGVVGMTTAWFLHRAGHRVTVIDAAAGPGLGTSRANGAQLSYRYVAPLAAPDVLPALPKYLLAPNSPMRFRPALDPGRLWRCRRFLRSAALVRPAPGDADRAAGPRPHPLCQPAAQLRPRRARLHPGHGHGAAGRRPARQPADRVPLAPYSL